MMNAQKLMRNLHRDIGFLVIGFTLLYALTGITLIYRDTNFLKKEKIVEQNLAPNLNEKELGNILRMRDFKVIKNENDILSFSNGTYNIKTGETKYSVTSLPTFLDKLNSIHKERSNNPIHIFSAIYAILLLFLAISSFWMFKPGSKNFTRGIIITVIGIIIASIAFLLH